MRNNRIAQLALSTLVLSAPAIVGAQSGTPRPFTLLPGERTSVPFGVAGTGTLTVLVQAQGQPLIVAVTTHAARRSRSSREPAPSC